ncbi:hypothetical protein CP98_04841 [Sphingobium yanoikuyae]|uniref:Uncharacterized protein n=1 Tax=Sphingobium yanoikuyae TaxID=13690 RepID=A0A084E957_SPHYA|nr:hypothetical protein [Sphingobium yanoikuyae]KEZ14499.1 hypothetical protein CP98_04841 [Sphingobium yanoikuyae]
MKPIERAARTLCRLDGHPRDGASEADLPWEDYLPQVRAVLKAVYEPSEWMAEAGAELLRHVRAGEAEQGYRQDAADIWRYMIDSMVKDVG